jgi:enoyl-CoA hydratase/carnithine racemase
MPYEMILAEQQGRVGVLKFKLNALHPKMTAEMREQIEALNNDPSVGAIVLTGEGRAFCAGADISGWNRQIERREEGEGNGQREQPGRLQRGREESLTEFFIRSKPVVVAINGPAIGAGLTITLPADVRIASPQSRLSMRFIRVGVLPELASTFILPHIVGMGNALELMLSGRIINGDEAARIGLVNRVVPAEKLLDDAIATAAEIAFNPTESHYATKRETWEHVAKGGALTEMMRNEMREFLQAQQRPSFKEAVRSFIEKRDPDFHKVER